MNAPCPSSVKIADVCARYDLGKIQVYSIIIGNFFPHEHTLRMLKAFINWVAFNVSYRDSAHKKTANVVMSDHYLPPFKET